jgi:hypothetical protein
MDRSSMALLRDNPLGTIVCLIGAVLILLRFRRR